MGERQRGELLAGDRGKDPLQREMPPTTRWQILGPRTRAGLPLVAMAMAVARRSSIKGRGRGCRVTVLVAASSAGPTHGLYRLFPSLSLKTRHLEQCFSNAFEISQHTVFIL